VPAVPVPPGRAHRHPLRPRVLLGLHLRLVQPETGVPPVQVTLCGLRSRLCALLRVLTLPLYNLPSIHACLFHTARSLGEFLGSLAELASVLSPFLQVFFTSNAGAAYGRCVLAG